MVLFKVRVHIWIAITANNLTNSHIPVSFRADLARFWKLPHMDDDDISMAFNYRGQVMDFCLASINSIHSTFMTSHLEHRRYIIHDLFIHRYALRI
jgi:hypothetical protein